MKTSELTGAALDWAVATASGRGVKLTLRSYLGDNPGPEFLALEWEHGWEELYAYRPSTDWALGGPIIAQELIGIGHDPEFRCWLGVDTESKYQMGNTPLVAAMRCYVASKLGDEIEIPKELRA